MTFSTDDFQALCTELVAIEDALTGRAPVTANQGQALDGFSALAQFRDIAERARAALAETEPQGPTDEELPPRVGHILKLAEIIREVDGNHSLGAAALAEAILSHPGSRWSPAIKEVPVAERLPGPEDCIRRVDDDWCWGQERSLLTGQAAARWRLMRVSSLSEEAVAWLPHWALPIPG